jgi:outer membrane protein assembly factor BamD
MSQSAPNCRRPGSGNPVARFAVAGALLLGIALSFPACSKPPTLLEEVPSAEELYREGLSILEGKRRFFVFRTVDYQKAIDTFQQIVDNYPYSDYAVRAELRIADSYFEQEKYEEALSYYRDFVDLHPQHEDVPYTIYRAALCYYRQSRSANRDQSATRKSIEYLDELLRRYPHAPQIREAEILWQELRTRLGEHVLQIGDFYLARSEYESAASRYQSVLDEFPGLGLDAQALYKLGVCYSAMNRDDDAKRIFEVILRNYEGTDVAEAAADLVPAAN